MKTSELMSKLNKITGIRAFNKSRLSVLDSTSECLAEVGTSGSFLNIYKNCPYEVSKLIVEYYLTPLEEREEEKKYCLMFPKQFQPFQYLGKVGEENYSRFDGKTSQTEFTQKEIDAMPQSWKNFFINEEIK